MKRRDFLKILSAVPAVAAVPALAKSDKLSTHRENTGWQFFLNGKQIPAEHCVSHDGNFGSPRYMKDGDRFEAKSPTMYFDSGYKVRFPIKVTGSTWS